MNKADLIEALAERLGDKKAATAAVEAVVDTVTRAVVKGEKVAIAGFGVFERVERAARTARNPATGATVKLKKTSVPKFRPGQGFKDVVSGAKKIAATGPSVGRLAGTAARTGATAVKKAAAPAKAAAAAKAMGKMPAQFQKRVDELLQPQVDWREHVRTLVTGRIGARKETWDRPNRRRLALNPMLILPGRRGHGAELVVVALDTSGSIFCAPKALEAFFSEVGGILADVRPRRVILIECDARVGRVSEAATLDDLDYTRKAGVTGGGGTSFVPPFEYLAEHGLVPDCMVYLTDLEGTFPKKPAYPVVWCTIKDHPVPFGDKVVIKS